MIIHTMKIYRGERKLYQENPTAEGRKIQLMNLHPSPLSDQELDYIISKKEVPTFNTLGRRYCFVTVNSQPLPPTMNLIPTHGTNYEWGYRGRLAENLSSSIVLYMLKADTSPTWFYSFWGLYGDRQDEEGVLDHVIDIFVNGLLRSIISILPYENWKLEELHLHNILTDIAIKYSKGRLIRDPKDINSLLTK